MRIAAVIALCFLVWILREAHRRRDATLAIGVVGSVFAAALLTSDLAAQRRALQEALTIRATTALHRSLEAENYERASAATGVFIFNMSQGSSFLAAMQAMDQVLRIEE